MPLYKESFLEDRIYQELQELKLEGIRIERSFNIRGYKPDIVLLTPSGYFAVIEIKRSLKNEVVYNNAQKQVAFYMKEINAPYGFISDGETTYFIDSTFNVEKVVSLSGRIKYLLADSNLQIRTEISSEEKKEIIWQLLKELDQRETEETLLDFQGITLFLYSLQSTDFIKYKDSISLTEEKERQFMSLLLGHYRKDSLCRYTTMAGLFRTLDSKKHSMVCLVGMNDKSETHYVQDYAESNGNHYFTSVSKLNDLFILSCCDEQKEDDLTMFRLYGDDSRGVCLKYGIKNQDNYKEFLIAPVSYANADGSHPKLDLFLAVSRIIQFHQFDAWIHFFKSYDYQVENEVRVLYERKDKKKKWVNISSYGIICPLMEFEDKEFPLILDKVLLGPNCPEKDVNNSQIITMIQEENIVIKYGVSQSKKDSYRVSNWNQ